jgi:hypothetical protein
VNAAEAENLLPYENSETPSLPYAEETVAPLRDMQKDIDLITSLLSDEKTVVEDLFGPLIRIVSFLPKVPLEPGIFEENLGEIIEAHVSPEGMLLYRLNNGLIDSLDLSEMSQRNPDSNLPWNQQSRNHQSSKLRWCKSYLSRDHLNQ